VSWIGNLRKRMECARLGWHAQRTSGKSIVLPSAATAYLRRATSARYEPEVQRFHLMEAKRISLHFDSEMKLHWQCEVSVAARFSRLRSRAAHHFNASELISGLRLWSKLISAN
jgi:hypothetical protein